MEVHREPGDVGLEMRPGMGARGEREPRMENDESGGEAAPKGSVQGAHDDFMLHRGARKDQSPARRTNPRTRRSISSRRSSAASVTSACVRGSVESPAA